MSKAGHKTAYLLIAAIVITGLVVGGVSYVLLQPPPEANVVTVYHWWTSGGEKAAIDAFVAYFNTIYPDVAVIQSPVAGGAGYVFKSVIKPLVLAGEAPDAFQMHAGYEGRPYYLGGYLENVNDLWASENWAKYIPPVVTAMCKFGGDYYAVPMNIHRANVLWYNETILNANGIDATTLTTWKAFFAACDTLDPVVDSPIALGDVGPWAAEHVFEQIIASQGIGFYQDWANGKVTSASDTTLLYALGNFSKYLTYVNSNHATLSWDQAIARLFAGTSVFSIMGDWANGEFLAANTTGAIHWGTNYGAQPSPGTAGYYGLVIDCFQHPKGTAHPANSLKWLTVVGSKAGQDTFNPLKGSIAARNDSDTTKYGAYQRLSAIPDFRAASHMFPSFTHGSGLPETVTGDITTAIADLVSGAKTIAQAASAMTSSITTNAADFTTTWSL